MAVVRGSQIHRHEKFTLECSQVPRNTTISEVLYLSFNFSKNIKNQVIMGKKPCFRKAETSGTVMFSTRSFSQLVRDRGGESPGPVAPSPPAFLPRVTSPLYSAGLLCPECAGQCRSGLRMITRVAIPAWFLFLERRSDVMDWCQAKSIISHQSISSPLVQMASFCRDPSLRPLLDTTLPRAQGNHNSTTRLSKPSSL